MVFRVSRVSVRSWEGRFLDNRPSQDRTDTRDTLQTIGPFYNRENLRRNIYIYIMYIVLNGCETWSVTIRKNFQAKGIWKREPEGIWNEKTLYLGTFLPFTYYIEI